jgi:uncharacterized membrane protein YhaH (DUF805 family)
LTNPYISPTADMAEVRSDQSTYSPRIFALSGRIGRVRYIAYFMLMYLLLMAAMIPALGTGALLERENLSMYFMVMGLIYIPFVVMWVILMRRRFNDTDHSGWFALLIFIPFVNGLVGLYLLFAPGSEGSNDFGPAPEANSRGVVWGAFSPLIVALIGIAAAVALPAYQDYTKRAKAAQSEVTVIPVPQEQAR